MLNVPGGKRFVVVADGLSPENRYIGGVTLNGAPLDRSWLRDGELRAGGELRFTMAAVPDKRWATGRAARPFSMSARR